MFLPRVAWLKISTFTLYLIPTGLRKLSEMHGVYNLLVMIGGSDPGSIPQDDDEVDMRG